jgi:hypothetical protein
VLGGSPWRGGWVSEGMAPIADHGLTASFGSPLRCAIIATLAVSFWPATVRCSFRDSMLQWAASAGRYEGAKAEKAVPFPGVAAH